MVLAARHVRSLNDLRSHRLRADIFGVATLCLLLGAASWPLFVGGLAVGIDTTTFFYPMYGLLGERLRAGDIPGWNPALFSGAPVRGRP
jgi:hypothetical protein